MLYLPLLIQFLTGLIFHLPFSEHISQDSFQIQVFETFDEFEDVILQPKGDRVIVVNFWATWCVPCIKELPYFEELGAAMKHENLEIILVSIDYKERLNDKVIPFIEKKNIQSKVVLLNDAKANNWIDRVDPSWSGAIPITLIIKGDERYFYEQDFDSTTALKTIIEPILKP